MKVLFTRFTEVKIDPVRAWWSTEAHGVGAPNVAEVENDAVAHPMYVSRLTPGTPQKYFMYI